MFLLTFPWFHCSKYHDNFYVTPEVISNLQIVSQFTSIISTNYFYFQSASLPPLLNIIHPLITPLYKYPYLLPLILPSILLFNPLSCNLDYILPILIILYLELLIFMYPHLLPDYLPPLLMPYIMKNYLPTILL